MKSLRYWLAVVVLSLSTVAFAQSDMEKAMEKPDAQKSDSQQAFDKIKNLAGSWEGRVTTFPPDPDIQGKIIQASLRVTSMGNALVHEMTGAGRPDHPVTMFYLDGDRLLLTHYCDAGNRPRMTGTMSPDGKTVEFQFLDVSGGTQYGHMDHAVLTLIDANHHVEEWTYMQPGDKPVRGRMDLQRVK